MASPAAVAQLVVRSAAVEQSSADIDRQAIRYQYMYRCRVQPSHLLPRQ
jgi:hypothetical protein